MPIPTAGKGSADRGQEGSIEWIFAATKAESIRGIPLPDSVQEKIAIRLAKVDRNVQQNGQTV